MKTKMLLLASMLWCVQLFAASAAGVKTPEIKVLTWNVLGDKVMDAKEVFPHLTPAQQEQRFKDNIRQLANPGFFGQCDFLCLQEIRSAQVIDVGNMLAPDYAVAAYAQKGPNGGVLLAYNSKKYKKFADLDMQLLHGGAVACGLFDDGSQAIAVCSVHISKPVVVKGQGDKNQGIDQLREVLNVIQTTAQALGGSGVPLIIAGDFNTLYAEVASDCKRSYGLKIHNHGRYTTNDILGKFGATDCILYNYAFKAGRAIPEESAFSLFSVHGLDQIFDWAPAPTMPKIAGFQTSALSKSWSNGSDHLPVCASLKLDPNVQPVSLTMQLKQDVVSLWQDLKSAASAVVPQVKKAKQ
ncbi:endonuclease/exonuclease/phosphatase family protein [Candidatus Babeliales bacterium]|nr:endonuclease/exonuclease/phosphatase family protein [Candidatus Babeliales bacterium]